MSETPGAPSSCPLSLRQIGQKFWLQELRCRLRLQPEPTGLWQLHRYLADLPAPLRQEMLHWALAASADAGDTDTRDQLTNTALVLLGDDVPVERDIYLSLPRRGQPPAADLALVLRLGGGVHRLTVYVPEVTEETLRLFGELARACAHLAVLRLLGASDQLLKLVSRKCQRLRELDVSGSAAVTDAGVCHLAAAPGRAYLRRLCLQQTEVSADGVLQLLERLPHLEYVGSSQTVVVLSQLTDTETQFALRELPEFSVSAPLLRDFSRLCPQLSCVSLVLQQVGMSLSELAHLPRLQHLTLRCKQPYLLTQHQLSEALWWHGQQLRTLVISGDVAHTIDVGPIATYCPNLEVLKLPSMTLVTGEAARVLTGATAPLLGRLRTFEYDCMAGVMSHWARDVAAEAAALRALLAVACRLRTVRCRPCPLVDDDVELILAHNPLSELEVCGSRHNLNRNIYVLPWASPISSI